MDNVLLLIALCVFIFGLNLFAIYLSQWLIDSGVRVDVNGVLSTGKNALTVDEDTVLAHAYGSDGSTIRALRTDASGHLQIDVLTMPSVDVEVTTNDTVLVHAEDADGNDHVLRVDENGFMLLEHANTPSHT